MVHRASPVSALAIAVPKLIDLVLSAFRSSAWMSMPQSTHSDHAGSSSPFRKGVPLLLGIAWNAPLATMLMLLIAGRITLEQSEYFFAAWGATIPVIAVSLAVSSRVQNRLLKPGADVARLRPKLWCLAAFWSAITVVAVVATLGMHH